MSKSERLSKYYGATAKSLLKEKGLNLYKWFLTISRQKNDYNQIIKKKRA